MKRQTSSSSSKSTTKKTKIIFNRKSNVIMEDKHKNSEVKIISDKDEPFFKYEEKEK